MTDKTRTTTSTPLELFMSNVPKFNYCSFGFGTYSGFFVIRK